MKGFYVEYETDTNDIYLYYRYPSQVAFKIMPVLGFWNLPYDDWVRELKNK
ncbi:hypothetical protein MAR621_03837 [Maribacter dokdonensis]|uniref:hypothetical protein n=1 Tax=Maribacter dokdonensis TaxID=320912 RepID=UPI001AFF2394|nr:hypothetical protein [Maribacter dokdonensis]CAG2533791.1 hypothetical protein MAR621_03837 [Maribacter dokdonensis]